MNTATVSFTATMRHNATDDRNVSVNNLSQQIMTEMSQRKKTGYITA